MSQCIFLRGARHLLTLRGPKGIRRGAALQDLGAIPDGGVLIRDGRIFSVGSTRRLENMREAQGALEIPMDGRIVLPGFVDPAISLTLQRHDGVGGHPRRASEFYNESLNLLRLCLQHGTVAARVLAAGDTGEWRNDLAVLRALQKIGDHPVRLRRAWRLSTLTPTGPEFLDAATVVSRRKLAHAIALRTHEAHAETALNILDDLHQTGLPSHLLLSGAHLSAFSAVLAGLQPWAVSLDHPPDIEEADALSTSGATVVLGCGKRMLELNGPHAVRTFLDRGGGLAIGSGYHPVDSPMYNMQMAIAIAVARLGLTPAEAISAATVNAAVICGCDDEIGSLEVGKQADLVVLNLADLSDLAGHFGTNHVAMVLRAGNVVLNRTKWRPPVDSPDRVRRKLL